MLHGKQVKRGDVCGVAEIPTTSGLSVTLISSVKKKSRARETVSALFQRGPGSRVGDVTALRHTGPDCWRG